MENNSQEKPNQVVNSGEETTKKTIIVKKKIRKQPQVIVRVKEPGAQSDSPSSPLATSFTPENNDKGLGKVIHPTNLPPIETKPREKVKIETKEVKEEAKAETKKTINRGEVITGTGYMRYGDQTTKPIENPTIQSTIKAPIIIKPDGLSPLNSPSTSSSGSGRRVVGVVGGVGQRPQFNRDGYQRRSDRDQTQNRDPNARSVRTPKVGDSYTPQARNGGYGQNRFGRNGYSPSQGRTNPGSASTVDLNQKGKGRGQNRSGKDKDKERYGFEEEEKGFKYVKKGSSQHLQAVPKSIDIMESITVGELAKKMNLKANDIISKLFKMGQMVTINQQIDSETAEIIADEYGTAVHIVSLYDETIIETEEDREEDRVPRAPIVTVMGHVDHGKTKLLDAIRNTNVVGGEFGGITQHIGAYKVSTEKGDIVFLDTPGHAAFSMMRARGAQVTDIVVLVVAANDGVMPQTREAIDHAKAAKVPIIVAINKMDLHDANPDRVMQQLSELGLMPEEWGGQTLYCKISALKKEGIDDLLDTILLQSEMLELKANPKVRAEGKILESRIDQGRGTVATVIVQKGTLHQGDNFVAGIYSGKVRAMYDDKGNKIQVAGPSDPVEITGLSDVPSAGDPFQVTEDEKTARNIATKRQELERLGENSSKNKITLENLKEKILEGQMIDFNVIIKGDVQGSVEALQGVLEKLSNSEIKLNVLRASAGAIIESDISLASASDAIVIGFNVRPTPKAQILAEREKVEIKKYNVIYDVVDDIKAAMEGKLTPDIKEVDIGKVEVRQVFKVPKVGNIAGSYVLEGKVKRSAYVRIVRDSIQISKDLIKISSLKHIKDDVKEVNEGYECGIGLENYQDIQLGDIFEIVETQEVRRKLEDA